MSEQSFAAMSPPVVATVRVVHRARVYDLRGGILVGCPISCRHIIALFLFIKIAKEGTDRISTFIF